VADGITIPRSRFSGIALISLGIACASERTSAQNNALVGLFGFNCAATVGLLEWRAMRHGILTWPAALLDAGIAVVPLLQMLGKVA